MHKTKPPRHQGHQETYNSPQSNYERGTPPVDENVGGIIGGHPHCPLIMGTRGRETRPPKPLFSEQTQRTQRFHNNGSSLRSLRLCGARLSWCPWCLGGFVLNTS